jgi:hypothetical protein
MNEAGHEAQEQQAEARQAPKPSTGEVRRQLDRAPSERYRAAEAGTGTKGSKATSATSVNASRNRRTAIAAGVAAASALVTFALITFDIGPGLLVIGLAAGWLTGLAAAGGAPVTKGEDAGTTRAATAAGLAAAGIALGLLLDALRAYAMHGVLLPWEYAMARFGIVAPLAIVLAAAAGWLRGR